MKQLFQNIQLFKIAKLAFATGIGQFITYATAPLLSRLFTSQDFAEFGLFYSLIITLAVAATLRIEYLIPSSKTTEEAIDFAQHANHTLWKFTGGLAVFVVLFYLAIGQLNLFVTLIPLGVVAVAQPQIFNLLSTKLERYNLNVSYRILTNIGVNGLSILFGYFYMGSNGLILGFLIGQFVSLFFLRFGIGAKRVGKEISNWKEKWLTLKTHAAFNTTQGIIETLQLSGTIWLLNILFGGQEAGWYFMTWKLIQAPVTLVSNTVFQVQFNKASELHHEKQSYQHLILKTAGLLFIMSFVFAICIFIWGPELFAWFFGADWTMSGIFARYLSIYFVFNFCVSPFSFVAILEEKQKTALVFTLFDLVVKLGTLLYGVYVRSIDIALIGYSIGSALVLLIQFGWYLYLSKPRR
jgi:O-antigen/teichoic acid export membrane protein